MKTFLESSPLILMEAAVAERVSRLPGITLHPQLFHTPLIYETAGRELLAGIYREYLDIAQWAQLPMLVAAPTWRLDVERVNSADVPASINTDAVRFLRDLVGENDRIRLGGLLGPKRDCYKAELSLEPAEAAQFHAGQAKELAEAGVDYLLGQTLPSVREAIGMARAMLKTRRPSMISFCIDPEGKVLDGTPLYEAIQEVDTLTGGELLGYMVNCAYPSFLHPEHGSPETRSRLIGFDANGSSHVPWSLETREQTISEPVEVWAEEMLRLHRSWGVRLLGGCCGTTGEHLRALCVPQ